MDLEASSALVGKRERKREERRIVPVRGSLPPFARSEVADIIPVHLVLAGGAVGVGDGAGAIGPCSRDLVSKGLLMN